MSDFTHVLESIRNNREYCIESIKCFFDETVIKIGEFRIETHDGEFHDQFTNSIKNYRQHRDQVCEVIELLTIYADTEKVWNVVHRFFESLIPYTLTRNIEQDNLKFIVHELLVYTIVILLKNSSFSAVDTILNNGFYVGKTEDSHRPSLIKFDDINLNLESLRQIDEKNNLYPNGLHSEMLKSGIKSGISFEDLVQAEFIIFLKSYFDYIQINSELEMLEIYYPVLLFSVGRRYYPFEVFMRSRSSKYFSRFRMVFGIDDSSKLISLIKDFMQRRRQEMPRMYKSFNFENLIEVDKIGTLT